MKIMDAEAAGRDAEEFVAFLKAASDGGLPDAVERFIRETARRVGAFRDLGPARSIGCTDAGLLGLVANDPAAAKVCTRVGADKLVVAEKDEAEFGRALRRFGFVMRRSG